MMMTTYKHITRDLTSPRRIVQHIKKPDLNRFRQFILWF